MRRAGREHAVALIDSPFQLMSLFEAVHAGVADMPPVILVRRSGLDRLLELGSELLDRSSVEIRPSPSHVVRAVLRGDHVVAGDLYSGLLHATIAVGRPRRIVVLDDGAATLRAVAALADGTAALHRAHSVRLRQRLVARPGTAGLYRLARRGRVTMSTGLASSARAFETTERADPRDPGDPFSRLERCGFHVRRHDFSWSRAVPIGEVSHPSKRIRRVVVGSSLAVDGLLDPTYYRQWLTEQLAHDGTMFAPHPREHAAMHRLAASLGAELAAGTEGLPVELAIRDLPGVLVVATLPSTAALTIAAIRGRSRTRICCTSPPDAVTTPRLTTQMASLLDAIRVASAGSPSADGFPERSSSVQVP